MQIRFLIWLLVLSVVSYVPLTHACSASAHLVQAADTDMLQLPHRLHAEAYSDAEFAVVELHTAAAELPGPATFRFVLPRFSAPDRDLHQLPFFSDLPPPTLS